MLAVTSLSQASLFIKAAQTSILSSGEVGLGKQIMLWGHCGIDCKVSDQQRSVHLPRNVSRDGCHWLLQCSFITQLFPLNQERHAQVLLINSFTVFLPVLGYFTISSLAEKFSFRWAMLYLP